MLRARTHTAANYRDADGIVRIVREGLCHRCGACVGVCPDGTLEMRDGWPVVVAACSHCNRCVRVCSGLEVNYPALGRQIYGEGGYTFGSLSGPVRAAWIIHATSTEIRRAGASGGAVTGLLVHALQRREVAGAILAIDDPVEPARALGKVARTVEEILAGARSRYTTAPILAVLKEIRDLPGPWAMVGLPCHIHALRKLQEMDTRWRNRFSLVVGLLCHYTLPWEFLCCVGKVFAPPGATARRVAFRDKSQVGWPDASVQIEFSDGSCWRPPLPVFACFNIFSRLAPLGRCMLCMDACAEFSDLAVGDPWIRGPDGGWKYGHPDGTSLVLVHTKRGEEILRQALADHALAGFPIQVEEALGRGLHVMMREKKEQVGLRLRWRQKLGWPVPRYPDILLPPVTGRSVAAELCALSTRWLPRCPFLQHLLLRFAFSAIGVRLMRAHMAVKRWRYRHKV